MKKGKFKVEVNGNKDYSIKELIDVLKAGYLKKNDKPSVRRIFNRSWCHIGYISSYSNQILIHEFKNDKKQPCGFWEFSQKIRSGRNLRLFLFTTEFSHTPDEENVSSFSKPERYSKITQNPLDYKNIHLKNDNQYPEQKSKKVKEVINVKSMDEWNKIINSSGKFDQNQNIKCIQESINKSTKKSNFPYKESSESCFDLKRRKKGNRKLDSEVSISDSINSVTEVSNENLDLIGRFSNHEFNIHKQKSSQEIFVPKESYLNSMNYDGSNFPNNLKNSNKKNVDLKKTGNLEKMVIKIPEETKLPKIDFKLPEAPGVLKSATVVEDKFKEQKSKLSALKTKIRIIDEKDVKNDNQFVGSGGQGKVSTGTWENSIIAIKSMKIDRFEKLILREISLLHSIGHPNIIHLFAVYPSEIHYNLVMEYFESNNLDEILFTGPIKKKFDLKLNNKNHIGSQICVALNYLHKQLSSPIIHRDIKPANILVNKNLLVKICDLGLSKCNNLQINLQTSRAGVIRGTSSFISPEIFLGNAEATEASDVWAAACTFVELYSEDAVWDLSECSFLNINDCIRKYLLNKQTPNIERVPIFLKEILKKCFEYNPHSRPDIKSILLLYNEQKKLEKRILSES